MREHWRQSLAVTSPGVLWCNLTPKFMGLYFSTILKKLYFYKDPTRDPKGLCKCSSYANVLMHWMKLSLAVWHVLVGYSLQLQNWCVMWSFLKLIWQDLRSGVFTCPGSVTRSHILGYLGGRKTSVRARRNSWVQWVQWVQWILLGDPRMRSWRGKLLSRDAGSLNPGNCIPASLDTSLQVLGPLVSLEHPNSLPSLRAPYPWNLDIICVLISNEFPISNSCFNQGKWSWGGKAHIILFEGELDYVLKSFVYGEDRSSAESVQINILSLPHLGILTLQSA